MSTKMIPVGVVECAMHMIDGLVSENSMKTIPTSWNHMNTVLAAWNQGCLELYQSLIPFAEHCHALFEEGYAQHDDIPGVFDYEVSFEFGNWYGKQILTRKQAPSEAQAEAMLTLLNGEFWAQCEEAR